MTLWWRLREVVSPSLCPPRSCASAAQGDGEARQRELLSDRRARRSDVDEPVQRAVCLSHQFAAERGLRSQRSKWRTFACVRV
jgi:hypothetical protein